MQQVDVVILGCGTAGQMAAYGAATAGRSVVMVEKALPGGTCANHGADARKPLTNAAETLHEFHSFQGAGLAGGGTLNPKDLSAFRAGFTDPVPARTRHELAKAGIRLVEGDPAFTGEDSIRVGEEHWTFERAAVCTGRQSRPLDIPGAERAVDASAFVGLDQMPPRVAFIGGSRVAHELAAVAAVAGVRVTVLEATEQPLRWFDADAVRATLAGLNAIGVRVLASHEVVELRPTEAGISVRCAGGSIGAEADLVVSAIGRVPATAGLDLAAAGVEHDQRGIRVDAQLQTTNPRIWAGGGVADTANPPFPATAARDGRVLRRNLVHDGQPRTHLRADPPRATAAAFTVPVMARSGHTEASARAHESLGPIDVASGDASEWKLIRQQRAEHAFYKFVYAGSEAARDRRLVGVHLVGPGADEAINLFATGLHDPAATRRLADTPAAYPSFGFNLLNAFRAGL